MISAVLRVRVPACICSVGNYLVCIGGNCYTDGCWLLCGKRRFTVRDYSKNCLCFASFAGFCIEKVGLIKLKQ